MSGDRTRARAHARHGEPPGPEFFTQGSPAGRAPLGSRSAAVDLPGLSIGFSGMDETWHQAFLRWYAPYARDLAGAPPDAARLTFAASRAGLDHYIEPPPSGVAEVNPVWVAVEPEPGEGGPARRRFRIRCCTYGLAASFSTSAGAGTAVFAGGSYDPRERAVENILRVASAWVAVAGGGLLMHSASIVKEGRGYLFFGQSGSGKSTLAGLSRRGQVVSDDLTLLLPAVDGRPEIVGAPFRGTYSGGEPVRGRFPVAAAFRLKKAGPGETASVEPMKRSLAMAEAIANLPFVVDQTAVWPDLLAGIERLLDSFPIRILRFRKDDDAWWDAVESAGD